MGRSAARIRPQGERGFIIHLHRGSRCSLLEGGASTNGLKTTQSWTKTPYIFKRQHLMCPAFIFDPRNEAGPSVASFAKDLRFLSKPADDSDNNLRNEALAKPAFFIHVNCYTTASYKHICSPFFDA
jgi:hypothetical protein